MHSGCAAGNISTTAIQTPRTHSCKALCISAVPTTCKGISNCYLPDPDEALPFWEVIQGWIPLLLTQRTARLYDTERVDAKQRRWRVGKGNWRPMSWSFLPETALVNSYFASPWTAKTCTATERIALRAKASQRSPLPLQGQERHADRGMLVQVTGFGQRMGIRLSPCRATIMQTTHRFTTLASSVCRPTTLWSSAQTSFVRRRKR